MTKKPFTITIETVSGLEPFDGLERGYDEQAARKQVEIEFNKRHDVRSIALWRGARIIDVFYGEWQSKSHYNNAD